MEVNGNIKTLGLGMRIAGEGGKGTATRKEP